MVEATRLPSNLGLHRASLCCLNRCTRNPKPRKKIIRAQLGILGQYEVHTQPLNLEPLSELFHLHVSGRNPKP